VNWPNPGDTIYSKLSSFGDNWVLQEIKIVLGQLEHVHAHVMYAFKIQAYVKPDLKE